MKCDKGPASNKTHHAVATRCRGRVLPWWKGVHLKTDATSHGARDPPKEKVRYEAVTKNTLHRDTSWSGDKVSNQYGSTGQVTVSNLSRDTAIKIWLSRWFSSVPPDKWPVNVSKWTKTFCHSSRPTFQFFIPSPYHVTVTTLHCC